MSSSFYPSRAIKTLTELANVLDEEPEQLIKISNEASHYYRPNPQPKSDGTVRMTYAVLQPLKRIQNKIKSRILDRIRYAEYLFYGIKRKDVKKNATSHCESERPLALITLDIKKFYPSITPRHVRNVWINFFNFSEPVAILLTKLTTVKNELPQGGKCKALHLPPYAKKYNMQSKPLQAA
jgi:hypothetical protein